MKLTPGLRGTAQAAGGSGWGEEEEAALAGFTLAAEDVVRCGNNPIS